VHVHAGADVDHHREVRGHPVGRLRGEDLPPERRDRQLDAGHPADLGRVRTRGVDHDRRLDVAAARDHALDAAFGDPDPGHIGLELERRPRRFAAAK
jgi:hypothetical protein